MIKNLFFILFLILPTGLLSGEPGNQENSNESMEKNSQEILVGPAVPGGIGGGLFAMSRFGFAIVSPFLALAIMLIFGERRPIWLALGGLGMPAVIWLLVVQILERPLP